MTSDIRAQAEALLALEDQYKNRAKTDLTDGFGVALRNDGPAVIRALLEQVDRLEEHISDDGTAEGFAKKREMKARIAVLEADLARLRAERDIYRDRQKALENRMISWLSIPMKRFEDPTPAEIAARVAQNRKEESDMRASEGMTGNE